MLKYAQIRIILAKIFIHYFGDICYNGIQQKILQQEVIT